MHNFFLDVILLSSLIDAIIVGDVVVLCVHLVQPRRAWYLGEWRELVTNAMSRSIVQGKLYLLCTKFLSIQF